MGVDFTATFGHSMKFEEIKSFDNELNNNSKYKVFYEFGNKFNNFKSNISDAIWKWNDMNFTFCEDKYQRLGMLYGPDYFIIFFSEHLFAVHHALRWQSFISNKEIQYAMRKVCFSLSDNFGSPIYLPDSHSAHDLLYENKTMDQLKQYLYSKYGEPSKSICEIQYINYHTGWNGYFIDKFDDLRK